MTRPTSRQRIVFWAILAGLPLILLALLELGLRAVGYGDPSTIFEPAGFGNGRLLVARARFASRYFPGDPSPPTPPSDAFLRDKPRNGFRVFVLGESSAAGFPYPSNGTFSRIVRDALTDLLPGDTVEVINLGVPATTSYALVDQVDDVLAHRPDAVLIYAGHNEYYGALGAASTIRMIGNPRVVRAVVRAQQLRTVQLVGNVVRRLRTEGPQGRRASRMEELARGRNLALDGPDYRRGVTQFESNLTELLGRLRRAGVPTFIGTLTSNVRDRPPFGSEGTGPRSADSAFAAGTLAYARGSDSAAALFRRARDLDIIRFRAPSSFDSVILRVASRTGSTVVPVAEAFEKASPGGAPGAELFFEHVHPRPTGTVMIARAFVEAIVASGLAGRAPAPGRRAPWPEYERRMSLTALDHAVADLMVRSLTSRWPFVPASRSRDLLSEHRPVTSTDSLALDVASGRLSWPAAKARAAQLAERAGDIDGAVREYAGLARDQPWNEGPYRFAARALFMVGRSAEARPWAEAAYARQASAFTAYALGVLTAADSTRLDRAARYLEESLRLGPDNPPALYQLSLVYARMRRLDLARTHAARLVRLAPGFPGLGEWLQVLGMR